MSDALSGSNASGLTRHIETQFHARHRRQLSPLLRLADMIEDLHVGDAGVPEGLFGILRRMTEDLEVQMKKEELILFPAIRRAGDLQLENEIAKLRAANQDLKRNAAEICRITNDLTLPQGACEPWETLYSGLAEFVADLEEHMRLENDVLFSRDVDAD
ncbi:hemerythrin domain-containing protein [Paracoccus rhizosphaerae]|uniref:Hemerythrin domain-containing protein n=1 Tax=Paracoccus rhizosphaerae TaxID=1133347 RepID=A0ABV6CHU1_9RHOB|nr:hemerythrin domain-containing protein [Paracoccus rhizosphaerae]